VSSTRKGRALIAPITKPKLFTLDIESEFNKTLLPTVAYAVFFKGPPGGAPCGLRAVIPKFSLHGP